MKYDESQIEIEYIVVDGKKIPVYKIPKGMSGPNPIKFYEDEVTEVDEDLTENTEIKSIESLSDSGESDEDKELDF